ncbi:MAG: iron-siderophore ABC transporter substrate-binding protein, partial [Marinobacter sp.]|uniref:iron-siderophore ABC transporter substrate-binding protein n=1 Tax=Marinobacter sp. TaxID=50741 RepID=UPI00299D41E2
MCTDVRRLALLLLLLLALPVQAAGVWSHERGQLELSKTPTRIVALNWAATEALLLLGVVPVGVADLAGYPVWVQEPPLPEGPQNVGSRSAPSLEAIAELKPDLIVTSGQLAPAWELLRGIAPTYVISVYDKGAEPYQRARTMLLTLAEILGRQERAQAVLAEQDQVMTQQRQRLQAAGLAGTPVALVNFMDDRHVRINAPNGILQAGLEGLGLRNAWQQPGNFWGFAMVG